REREREQHARLKARLRRRSAQDDGHRRHGLEREIRIRLSENVRRRNGDRRRWRVRMTSHDKRDATEEERNVGLCERNVVRGGGARRRLARWPCPADKA